VVTSGLRGLIENAPLVYVGRNLGGGEAARTELAGRVAVILDSEAPAESIDHRRLPAAAARHGRAAHGPGRASCSKAGRLRCSPCSMAERSA